jgi:hypothetical protein
MAQEPYLWRGWRFDPPKDLHDQTVIVLVDKKDGPVSHSVTLTLDELAGQELDAYVADQVRELSSSLSGYQLKKKDEKKVGGLRAVVLEQTATSPDGAPVLQRQAYVQDSTAVLVVTATSGEGARKACEASFDAVLASLKKS